MTAVLLGSRGSYGNGNCIILHSAQCLSQLAAGASLAAYYDYNMTDRRLQVGLEYRTHYGLD